MLRHTTILLLGALVCWGCTSDRIDPAGETTEAAQGQPITLGVAAVADAVTRAVKTGDIDYSVLAGADCGFGVYAHSATTDKWTADWVNTHVTYNGPTPAQNPSTVYFYPNTWTYGPLKYWDADLGSGAAIDFYAYAPYVSSAPDGCITSVPSNALSLSVGYTVSDYTKADGLSKGVDLLWGIKGDTGWPWKGTKYESTGGPVLFTFRHALSAIGFRIQAMIDRTNDTGDLEDRSFVSDVLASAEHYKLTVKKVELKGDFHPSAKLSLDNTEKNTPAWSDKAAVEAKTFIIDNSQIVASIQHPDDGATTNTTTAESILIKYDAITGVTQDVQQHVVADHNGREQCFYLIPSDARDYTVTLYWCLSGKMADGTYKAEDYTSELTVSNLELVGGTKYMLTFVIGLRTIGLEVTAEDWLSDPQTATVVIEHGTSASESLARPTTFE